MKTYGVIMAGGGGTRFWPLSRKETPKQLLNLSGKELMINETIDRITCQIPRNDIFIVTNKTQKPKMLEATAGRIIPEHILSEAAARNTAACVGYAAITIMKKYGDGIMCVFPADHFIKDEQTFSATLSKAISVATESDKLVTMGITPTFPSTGYGYIKYDMVATREMYADYKVLEFKEKPDLATAKEYLASGQYAWNSGMFVWKASVILEEFKKYLPDIYEDLLKIENAYDVESKEDVDSNLCDQNIALTSKNVENIIDDIYKNIRSISIDYGIMEQSDKVVVIPAEFGWSDVGSFDNLGVMYDADDAGNIIYGNHIGIDTKNSIVYAKNKLVATIDVEDIVVVETDDTVLVCKKDRVQDVKKIVEKLAEDGRSEYL